MSDREPNEKVAYINFLFTVLKNNNKKIKLQTHLNTNMHMGKATQISHNNLVSTSSP